MASSLHFGPDLQKFPEQRFLAKNFWHNSIQESSQQQIKLGFSVAM